MNSILIIDNQQDLLDNMRVFLERYGEMNVESAMSSKEALAKMKERNFDAVVLELDLPEIPGIEFLKIIRAKGDTTPVVIFTGMGGENTVINALNNGADFFLKKSDDPQVQFRGLVHMINQAVGGRTIGSAIGTADRLIADAISFFSEPAFALDREGKVIAWNRAMAEFTGITPKNMVGKGDGKYSVPFFGHKGPMLPDMVFDDDALIAGNGYTIINRDRDYISAWIKTTGKKGEDRVLWMKAAPLHDGRGIFISTLGTVRDITDELGAELLRQSAVPSGDLQEPAAAWQGIRLDKLLGKATGNYKKGLHAYYREGNYPEAIRYFNQAIEIDSSLAVAWHDRGVALRELGKDNEALKSIDKAIALEPNNEEFLFTRAELLKRIGILQGQKKAISAAVQTYNRVVRINPKNADAWSGLGVCMREQGKDEKSRHYFEHAQELVRWSKSEKKERSLGSIV